MNWKNARLICLFILMIGGSLWTETEETGAASNAKGPPPPPPKVFPDGTPWIPVDQVAALERAHKVPELVKKVLDEAPSKRRLRLGQNAPG